MKNKIFTLCALIWVVRAESQTPAVRTVLFDGTVIIGYADHGAFINCNGPGVRFTHKPFSAQIGFLSSLRIKEDRVLPGAPKSSILTPSLGAGLTLAMSHLALQVPLYYNAKTSTKDGKWNPGIGIGYKF